MLQRCYWKKGGAVQRNGENPLDIPRGQVASMEEDWILKEGIDLEAQRREWERHEQAHCDRLIAEEIQGDISHLPLDGEVERDFPVGETVDIDEQHALLMSIGLSPSSLSTPPAPSGPSTTRQPISNTTPHQNITQIQEDDIISHLPRASQECWVAIEEDYATPPTSPPLTRIPPPATDVTPPSPNPPSPSHQSSFLPLTSTPPSADTPFEGFDVSSCCFESDMKLAELIQQQEQEEEERRQKLSSLDHSLAMELMREETAGEEEREAQLLSQSQSDAAIARALQEEESVAKQSGKEGGGGGSEADILLVQRLQREENDKLQQRNSDEQLARALQNEPDTSRDEEIARGLSTQDSTARGSTSASSSQNIQLLASQPDWWTPCPNCPSNSSCKYHLIDISRSSSEWQQVTSPFRDAGFTPHRLQRVQNMKLYQRLEFEKRSMKMDREDGYQVNETLLFHTTSAAVSVICSEGLDQRLSRKGRFGSGVYFR